MKKIAVIALVSALLAGCSTFTPYNSGVAMGEAVYLGYTRVAEKQDEEFRNKVKVLWEEVNSLESIDDLVACADRILFSFDTVINSEKLRDEDRVVLLLLRQSVMERVDAVVSSKLQSNEDAVEFLKGLREGVNRMIAIEEIAKNTSKESE